jgi:hypothetical protein
MTSAVLLILLVAVYVSVPAVMISGWGRWYRRAQPHNAASILSLIGFTLATASVMLALGSVIYALAIGGFAYYDPLLLSIYRCGILLALAGFAFAVIGVWRPHDLRWHSPLLSVGMLLFWFLMAIGE